MQLITLAAHYGTVDIYGTTNIAIKDKSTSLLTSFSIIYVKLFSFFIVSFLALVTLRAGLVQTQLLDSVKNQCLQIQVLEMKIDKIQNVSASKAKKEC